MDGLPARLLLGAVVLASSAFAIRYYDGHDFVYNVWAAIHGLLAGHNPYDPADVEHLVRYQLPVVAGLYLPAALVVHAPLALLSAARAADVMAVLNAGLIWLGVLLLIPPQSARSCLVAAVAGALVVVSAPAQDTIELGQLSGSAFAGLALLAASLTRDSSAVWLPTVGTALVALKPQSGVPLFAALAVLGYWRVAGRAALILALASIPGGVLFVRAAGSWHELSRTIGDNLQLVSRLPPVDLANPANLRVDALGVLSRLHGPALTGPGWILVAFLAATVLFVVAVRVARRRGPGTLPDPYIATLVGVYVVASLYHLMYDQLLLYVGPLAAVALLTRQTVADRRTRVVAAGGAGLIAAGLAFRVGFRARMVAAGLPELAVREAWVTIPTLIGLAIVVGALVLDRRAAPSRNAPSGTILRASGNADR